MHKIEHQFIITRFFVYGISFCKVALSSKIFKDARQILALQIVGRAIAFFASTYAMRKLGPEQLGIGAFVLSIVAQGAILGDMGLSIAGVRTLANNPDQQTEIVSLIFGIRLRVAILLSAVMLTIILNFHIVGSILLWCLAVPLLITTILNAQWIFQGLEIFPVFNRIQLFQAIVMAVLYIVLFSQGARAELYITVALIAQVMAWLIAYYYLCHKLSIGLKKFSWVLAWRTMYDSRYAFALIFTIFVYTGIEIPLITLLLSTKVAGVYRAAQSLISAIQPLLLMLPILVYPRLIAWKNRSDQEFKKNILHVLMFLSILAIALDLGAFIFVPLGFKLLFGQGFESGIWPAKLLLVSKGFVLLNTVPAWGLLAYGMDKSQLKITLFVAGLSIVLNIILIPKIGPIGAAGVNAFSELLILVLSTLSIYRFLSWRKQNKEVYNE